MFLEILKSMRPKQWYKNLVVFLTLIFSKSLFNIEIFYTVFLAFILFILTSGAVYIINDIKDKEKDKNHPTKKKRPIASGKISTKIAGICSTFLILFSIGFSFYFLNKLFLMILVIYLIENLFYTFYLKKIVIVDVITISFGFVLRAIGGAVVASLKFSPWVVLCTFLLALVLGLGKRKMEYSETPSPVKFRENLGEYTSKEIDSMLNISIASLIISYSVYTFLSREITMMITIPFGIYALFRYLQIVSHGRKYFLADKTLILNLVLWLLIVVGILYNFDNFLISLLPI